MQFRLASITVVVGLVLFADPAAAIRQFIVFFAAGDAERLEEHTWAIGPEGDAVIAEAAEAFNAYHGGGTIIVVGRDQRVGAADLAYQRSCKRALAVKAALVRHGVPENAVFAIGRGFTELFIETAEGVKEPQNRNASIDLASNAPTPAELCAPS